MDTYAFDQFQVTITGPGGSFSLGTNAGEKITIIHSGKPNMMTVGAGGDVMQSLSVDKSGRATVQLLRNSQVNAQLSQLYSHQRSSGGVFWGRNTIEICDMGGNVKSTCQGAAFVNPPANGKCEFTVGIIDS
jgi:Protein of unknown function (DUF3277)